MTAAIETVGLTKYYGPFTALCSFTVVVPEGEVVALLGPNGAGKSTTLKLLAGSLAPTSGSARVAGYDTHTERLQAAARIGYLPENGPLYADMTARQLLRFFGRMRGLASSELEDRLARVAAWCVLDGILDKPIGELSKGLRQRVGLAQALLHDPDVLLLDEPTAGLDPNQVREFRSLVQQLRSRKTLLISTHILPEVEALADRVLLVSNGALIYDGTPAALKSSTSLEDRFYELTSPNH